MRKCMIVIFVALITVWGCSPEPPKTEEQKTLYALGAHLNKQLSLFDLTSEELKFVVQGLSDASSGKKLAVDPEAQITKIGELAQSRVPKIAAKSKAAAKPFLEKAAAAPGAQKTASGLIYKEIKAGTGVRATPKDIVTVHYVGSLIDGKEFDSSIKRGKPLEIPLDRIIPCWTEGISMMKVGGKAELVCPPETAYGDAGRPPVVAGGSTLVFQVELLDVKSGEPPPAASPAPDKAQAKSKKRAPTR